MSVVSVFFLIVIILIAIAYVIFSLVLADLSGMTFLEFMHKKKFNFLQAIAPFFILSAIFQVIHMFRQKGKEK